MNEKKLFMRKPLIWTTPTYGDLFSVTDDRILPWVYNNFIQLEYSHEWMNFVFEDHHLLLDSCPALKSYCIAEDFVRGCTLHDLVVEMINRDCYILLWTDRYYLPCYKEYGVNHVNHEIFIYGYDMGTDRIYFADNLSDGKYENVFCTSKQFEAAYYAVDRENDFIKDIHLFRKRSDFECSLNREQIMDGLTRYLYSKKSFYTRSDHNGEFGIDIFYDLLSNKREEICNVQIDCRPFHLLYEHKVLMRLRVSYMIECKYISAFDMGKILELEKKYLLLRNVVIKCNISKKFARIEEINDMLNQNLILEKEVLGELLFCMENSK